MRHLTRLALLLLGLFSLSSCGKNWEEELIGQDGDSWQLHQSYMLMDNGDTSLLTDYNKREIWQQSEPGTLSLSFKKEGRLDYRLMADDEKANLKEKGKWSVEGDHLSFHPQKPYFDAEDPNQQWELIRLANDTLILQRKPEEGTIVLQFLKQSAL